MSDFKLNILGCGSATPSLRHLPACQVIYYRGSLMMIDCGEGAQLSMRRQRLKFSRLNHIFISHLHGDHCLGLPGLLSTLALQDKGGTVTVHTFADGVKIFSEIMEFFCRERPFDLPGLAVEAIPLRHRVPCVGYIFREKSKPRHLRGDMVKFLDIPVSQLHDIKYGADYTAPDGRILEKDMLTTPAAPAISYAYCSDTVLTPSLAREVEGVDWLYHEATYTDEASVRARERYHSTASEAARIAADAPVGPLLLGHFSKAYTDESTHLAEARAIFPSTTVCTEGQVFDLANPEIR